MALPIHCLSEFYPYAKLKPKEINFDHDTWLTEPMSRLLTNTVSSELVAAIFIRQHVLRWPLLTLTPDRENSEQSIAAASRRESEKRPGTGGRRETQTARASGGGGGRRRQALQLPAGERTADREADNAASAR